MNRVLNKSTKITVAYSKSHEAVDLGWSLLPMEVLAHSSGTVVIAVTGKKNNKGSTGTESYGNFIKIKHSNGWYTLSAHLSRVDVKVGQTIERGQIIGIMGNSGNAYGIHLHFEVRNEKDIKVNPTDFLNADLPNLSTEPVNEPVEPVSEPVIYTVLKGDNLTKIARKYNTTVSKLIELNSNKYPKIKSSKGDYIQTGWTLKIK